MKLDDSRESGNIEDRRGGGGMRVGGGIGIGTIVLALVAMYFGVDPSFLLNPQQDAPQSAPQQQRPADPNVSQRRFVARVLGETEDTWTTIFREGGTNYEAPTLVLFDGQTRSACGLGEAAMGPFYCPGDRKVYIDLAFYRDLQNRFKAPGDFAQAYVIAHEVGHHVQNLLGITKKVDAMRGRVSEREMNALSVRVELQADCFAGVWARSVQGRNRLEPGDIEEGLTAAAAIGDDRLQKQARGVVVPESFTHGSSEQRVRWFKRGYEAGSLKSCDTFASRQL
jgi:predicted metalloprotease